ncbi:MAG: SOS response-associated peptidase family protein [Akkermansiaceae bacterium]|nr:SOS response-associated peptidase family protein [Akkermansiaceae bacterium]
MCSTFEIKKVSGKDLASVTASIRADGQESKIIRRTDIAPVFLSGMGITEMRWGFERPRLGVVNNTRSENLDSPMWRESIRARRCLIPMSGFYEWSGAKGHKRTHRFGPREGLLLWAAGIWEDSEQLGRCFSMLTTAANRLMAPVHHRMPALLTAAECDSYLEGNMRSFSPGDGMLVVNDAANPLTRKPQDDSQGDLFDF